MKRNLVSWSASVAVAGLVALALPAMAETAAPDSADAPKATTEAAKPAAEAPKLAETEVAAPKGMTLKIGDTAWFKFGGMFQAWGDWNQDPVTEGYIQNLYLRRTRFNIAGKVANGVYFYWQTENANLGKSPKALGSGFQTLDATVEWRLDKTFNIQAGLIYVPDSREALKSSTSQYLLDTSAYATLATAAMQGSSNRDTGFGVRGFLVDDHLEYRVLALQGVRDASSKYGFRYLGRLSYNFFDKEMYTAGFTSIASSYNGTKSKILAIGTAYDFQRDFELYTADIFWSIPFKTGRLEGQVWYQSIDGGALVTALPKQNTATAEAGWYFEALKTAAWGRYERRQYSTTATKDEKRYWGGLTYYVFGNNLNLKAGYQRLVPAVGTATNDLTLAIQMSY